MPSGFNRVPPLLQWSTRFGRISNARRGRNGSDPGLSGNTRVHGEPQTSDRYESHLCDYCDEDADWVCANLDCGAQLCTHHAHADWEDRELVRCPDCCGKRCREEACEPPEHPEAP